ncbi:hypothetical protein SDC9_188580 [bioreactor metagenome]|uniref:Uncharacterized protein n=1 Tax=bioreactor metagenome TaxID=1076179 RepID=A0A645HQB2_9ZZZZ
MDFFKVKTVPFLGEKYRQNQEADNPCTAGCKHRTENTHFQWKNKEIVQRNIRKAARHHRQHGQLRRAVISDKAQYNTIHNKERCKNQKYPQIGVAHVKNIAGGPQCGGNGTG